LVIQNSKNIKQSVHIFKMTVVIFFNTILIRNIYMHCASINLWASAWTKVGWMDG